MSDIPKQKQNDWISLLQIAAGIILLGLIAISLAGPVMIWPFTDEANYILEARKIAQGLLPYRDFYEFITPGGQALGALLIALNGFSVVGLRLLVLLGWLMELLLVYDMAKERLSKGWLVMLLAFLWLTDSRYPVYQHHFWSGFTALLAVYFVHKHLKALYGGQTTQRFLVLAGITTGLTFWITQSLGVVIMLALGLFGGLHCFLHEREIKDVTFREVSNRQVLRRWLGSMGKCWALPMLGMHGAAVGLLIALGIWPAFLRDAVFWLIQGNYQRTTVIGFFSTFHQEFQDTLLPLIKGVPMPYLLLFLFRIPIAFHLFLMGLLPVLGMLGGGILLPSRFWFRLMRREDEELLLWWLAGSAMILSTFSYSTSMHIVSNGALAYLTAAVVLQGWIQRQPRLNRGFPWVASVFLALLLIGAVVGSAVQLTFGAWLPRFPGIMERMLYTEAQPDAYMQVVGLLLEAAEKGRTVLVFSETPSLYLPDPAIRNASRFTLIIPLYTSPAQIAEIMKDLERNQPLYIVNDNAMSALAKDTRFSHAKPEELHIHPLETYIAHYYRLLRVAGRYEVYKRI